MSVHSSVNCHRLKALKLQTAGLTPGTVRLPVIIPLQATIRQSELLSGIVQYACFSI